MSVPVQKIPMGVTGPRNPLTDLRTKLAALAPPPWEGADSPDARWFVCQSAVNSEFRAAAEVRLLHFRAFVPVEVKWAKHANRRTKVERPLFSRYFFVRFDSKRDPWGAIQSARGVEGLLLLDGSEPGPIPDEAVNALFRAQQAGKFDKTVTSAAFEAGSQVTVEEGPFAGLVGDVVDGTDKDRVEVLIRLFNMRTKMFLDASMLRAS